jgi:hypothetical protein
MERLSFRTLPTVPPPAAEEGSPAALAAEATRLREAATQCRLESLERLRRAADFEAVAARLDSEARIARGGTIS